MALEDALNGMIVTCQKAHSALEELVNLEEDEDSGEAKPVEGLDRLSAVLPDALWEREQMELVSARGNLLAALKHQETRSERGGRGFHF